MWPRRGPDAGRRIGAALAVAAILGLWAPLGAGRAEACAAAIVLAIDVSSSVSAPEYRLQAEGHARTFRDPEVIEAIQSVGGVMVTVVHWSGVRHQQARESWTLIDSAAASLAFADRIGAIGRRYDTLRTALGQALVFLEGAWLAETARCERKVIDISGDGVANDGVDVAGPRARLLAQGVTINALVIFSPLSRLGAEPDPVVFYRERVIGGPGAFYEVADGYEDYARAFKRKFLQELRGGLAEAPATPTALPAGLSRPLQNRR